VALKKKPTDLDVDKNVDVFFCLIAFSGFSQQWKFKGTPKNVLQKSRAEKLFFNRPKKTFFSRFVFNTFWEFLGGGGSRGPRGAWMVPGVLNLVDK
jgi:hypothetical protein